MNTVKKPDLYILLAAVCIIAAIVAAALQLTDVAYIFYGVAILTWVGGVLAVISYLVSR